MIARIRGLPMVEHAGQSTQEVKPETGEMMHFADDRRSLYFKSRFCISVSTYSTRYFVLY